MADKQDLYEVLGVPRDAERDAIRKAYRKLARQYHPDLNPGDAAAEERFKQLSMAWEVLQDPERRRSYDEFGEVSLEAGFDPEKARQAREAFGSRFGFEGHPGASGSSEEFHFGNLEDLFGGVFGHSGAPRNVSMRGADLEAGLELEFEEAIRGGEKRLTLNRPDMQGGVETKTLSVRIPPGVRSDGRLRLAGKGDPGIGGGPPGDLFVRLTVRPHRVFRREGRDLEFDLPLSVREAIQGGPVEVPTLDGRVALTIPPGTDSGTRLRLRGKGVPGARGGEAGDLFARVQIRVPRDLDGAAEEALEALAPFEDPAIRKELF
jgi:DnaJ-class molecular chaperone